VRPDASIQGIKEMMQKIVRSMLASAAAMAAVTGCATEQAAPVCAVGHGGFATVYTVKSNPNACPVPAPEIIGGAKFSTREDTKGQIVIMPAAAYDAADEVAQAQATGNFTTELPNAQNICEAPTLSAIDLGDIKYQFKNVQVYTTAAANGTQMSGEVTIVQAGCSAEFTFISIAPAIHCDGENAAGDTVPDASLCDPNPNVEEGRAFGSGINPDFPTRCDDTSFLCVPTFSSFVQI